MTFHQQSDAVVERPSALEMTPAMPVSVVPPSLHAVSDTSVAALEVAVAALVLTVADSDQPRHAPSTDERASTPNWYVVENVRPPCVNSTSAVLP